MIGNCNMQLLKAGIICNTLLRCLIIVCCVGCWTSAFAQTADKVAAAPAEAIQEAPASTSLTLLKQAALYDTPTVPVPESVAVSAASAPRVTATEQAIDQNNALAEGEKQPKSSSAAAVPSGNAAVPAASLSDKQKAFIDKYSHLADGQAQPAASSSAASAVSAGQTSAAASVAVAAPAKTKAAFDPNEYRPGVTWKPSQSTHFNIYTQARSSGIGSSNMQMTFEAAYETLRRNIPWMMSGKVRVFVYQDHDNYLKYEPRAKAWTRALSYPTRDELVVYDEPGKQKELQEVFTHELVHVFTQQFFAPKGSTKLMTPVWLDEGLAVYMEDQAYNGSQGGQWSQDLRKFNIVPDHKIQTRSAGILGRTPKPAGARRRGRRVVFVSFDKFIQEGSLAAMEKQGRTQDWYLQAYAMVRFLLNRSGGSSPSNRMQFEQLTKLLAQGELKRDPVTGYPLKDKAGNSVYQPYSLEKALKKVYYYNSLSDFEEKFWQWLDGLK